MRLPAAVALERTADPRFAGELSLALRRIGGVWQVVVDPGGDELPLGGLDELITCLQRIASAERPARRGLR